MTVQAPTVQPVGEASDPPEDSRVMDKVQRDTLWITISGVKEESLAVKSYTMCKQFPQFTINVTILVPCLIHLNTPSMLPNV